METPFQMWIIWPRLHYDVEKVTDERIQYGDCQTGSTYISAYRNDRDFVPNLNHMPTTSRCRRNFHLHSNSRWHLSIPEILISTLSVTMETPFQMWIIWPRLHYDVEKVTDERIQYGDCQTGSTYISAYCNDRDFVPNPNHMTSTSQCRRNFH